MMLYYCGSHYSTQVVLNSFDMKTLVAYYSFAFRDFLRIHREDRPRLLRAGVGEGKVVGTSGKEPSPKVRSLAIPLSLD